MIDLSTLLTVGVIEIGRRSDSMDLGGFTLGIGRTLACFHISGMLLSRILSLKIAHMGSQSSGAKSRNTQFGKLSWTGSFIGAYSLQFVENSRRRNDVLVWYLTTVCLLHFFHWLQIVRHLL